ncbi:uncharacterized protein LOC102803609 [Saccoglossus kowalevskii]|uniref:Uncharacterized protein LOC102803609 n=1 Tax=Saccoglossus kowalevskii TaxID=10224 RepID=A0ABM0M7C0_SACKO|nr:PREDICTED: uncharacterized protein LOC102803609 [Saccoglossus kowalevskii]
MEKIILILMVIIAGAVYNAGAYTSGPRFCPKISHSVKTGQYLIGEQHEKKACGCYQACEDLGDECQMWTFQKRGRTCRLYRDSNTNATVGKGTYGMKNDVCRRNDNKNRKGGSMGIRAKKEKSCDCHDFCVATRNCVAWSWHKISKLCRLKNEANKPTKSRRYVSGTI